MATHYKTNFNVSQYHQFSLSEIENMIPFEREIYVQMLAEKVKKEKEERTAKNGGKQFW